MDMFKTRFISMLVLLMTAVTGAWAQITLLTTILSADNASFKSGSKTFDNIATVTFSGNVYNDGDYFGWYFAAERTLTVTAAEGYTITRVKFYNKSGSVFDKEAPFEAILVSEGGIVTKVNGKKAAGGVTKIEVYGYANPAPTTYKVSVKEGTEDATSWQGKAGTGEYQALPLEGVAAGTAVSVKNSGTKKVKSVKAVKKPYTMAAAATSADKGKLICTDGHIHAYGEDVACTKARVAKIIYIGPTGHADYTHGLALAMEDVSKNGLTWDNSGANNDGKTAAEWCSAWNTSKPVKDAEWLLASQAQWNYMMGTDGAGSDDALSNGFSSVGGSNFQWGMYWSSTEDGSSYALFYHFGLGWWNFGNRDSTFWVRACLAF